MLACVPCRATWGQPMRRYESAAIVHYFQLFYQKLPRLGLSGRTECPKQLVWYKDFFAYSLGLPYKVVISRGSPNC